MSSVVLKLEHPITDGQGNNITELTIRRPKVKDMRKMRGDNDLEQSISLIAIVTGLVPEDLDELDIVDVKRASEILEKMQKGKSA
ncbi:phage tail assembly protein [Histophilus somni]|nr:phage tail assembly protein [Histophilus somni]NBI42053.1 phage tail assembly protein [[Haemophilus] felis]THA21164.1 phage tail assembly protein [Histophilus somni]